MIRLPDRCVAEDRDLAEEVAQIICDAAGKAEDVMSQRQSQIAQPDVPRLSLDLTFGTYLPDAPLGQQFVELQ